MVIKEVEKPMLEEVMKFCNGNKSQASKILGINRVTLRTKLKQYNIKNG
ncbi:MAG: helix-turn-helix domain-containing protein [Gammaproteobacteria bacterium]